MQVRGWRGKTKGKRRRAASKRLRAARREERALKLGLKRRQGPGVALDSRGRTRQSRERGAMVGGEWKVRPAKLGDLGQELRGCEEIPQSLIIPF